MTTTTKKRPATDKDIMCLRAIGNTIVVGDHVIDLSCIGHNAAQLANRIQREINNEPAPKLRR